MTAPTGRSPTRKVQGFFVHLPPEQHAAITAAAKAAGESISSFMRRAAARELVIADRAAMRLAADARAAETPTTDRAELELHATPTKGSAK